VTQIVMHRVYGSKTSGSLLVAWCYISF